MEFWENLFQKYINVFVLLTFTLYSMISFKKTQSRKRATEKKITKQYRLDYFRILDFINLKSKSFLPSTEVYLFSTLSSIYYGVFYKSSKYDSILDVTKGSQHISGLCP